MDAIPLFGRDPRDIQVACIELSQRGRGVEEAELDLIDLCPRNRLVPGPERILDQGQI